MKSPQEFCDFSRVSKPTGILDLQQRITYNVGYFASNYLLIVLFFLLYCIITNIPFFLFLFVELGLAYYIQTTFGHGEEIDFNFFSIHQNVWYTILLVINVPLFLFWSPLSSLLWLLFCSAAIIVTHAAIMEKPVETYSDAV